MRKLQKDDFETDESRSNPMVVAVKNKHCPINEICFYVAPIGSNAKKCEHMVIQGEDYFCPKMKDF